MLPNTTAGDVASATAPSAGPHSDPAVRRRQRGADHLAAARRRHALHEPREAASPRAGTGDPLREPRQVQDGDCCSGG
jgi:hypothetical protein